MHPQRREAAVSAVSEEERSPKRLEHEMMPNQDEFFAALRDAIMSRFL